MIKKVALIVGILLLGVLAFAAVKSPDYRVSREVTIQAPAEKIFPYLNNSKLAGQWGPWTEMDPESKMTISGPEAGVGSRTDWTGGKQMGTGSATIVESTPNQRVGIRIVYTDPMDMVQDSEYLIRAENGQNVVTWTVTGKNSFVGRLMCLFADMDKMVGPMFEKGLNKLKALAEK